MNYKFGHNGFKVCISCLSFFLFFMAVVDAAEQKKSTDQQLSGLRIIIDKVRKSVQTKNFGMLKQYVSNAALLHWAACGPGDVEPEKISFDSFAHRLTESSIGADINVYQEADIRLWDFEKPVYYTININTEGWTGEYPYISFGFKFKDNRWQLEGVCDSAGPPLTISQDGKRYEEIYYSQPKLPRRGPRVFKDREALKTRIREILRFKVFDALKPYAVSQKLILGECSREMMDSDEIRGNLVSVNQVIDFLEKNYGEAKEITPAKGHYYKYLETEGWNGQYPYISFWLQEGKNGWTWAGVAYCKSSLLHLQFPNESRFK